MAFLGVLYWRLWRIGCYRILHQVWYLLFSWAPRSPCDRLTNLRSNLSSSLHQRKKQNLDLSVLKLIVCIIKMKKFSSFRCDLNTTVWALTGEDPSVSRHRRLFMFYGVKYINANQCTDIFGFKKNNSVWLVLTVCRVWTSYWHVRSRTKLNIHSGTVG